MLNSLTLQ